MQNIYHINFRQRYHEFVQSLGFCFLAFKEIASWVFICLFAFSHADAFSQAGIDLNSTQTVSAQSALTGNVASSATSVQRSSNVIEDTRLINITRPFSLGCNPAHGPTNAKSALVSIPIDDDLVVPVGGRLNAPWVPPAPVNPEASIHGVDMDNDCVRDDIERYISKLYWKGSQFELRENMFRYAIWMNRFLNPNITEMDAKIAVVNLRIASTCVRNLLGDEVGRLAVASRMIA